MFIVMTARAQMPASVKARYGRVAVVEVQDGPHPPPKMISTHARGVVRIVRTWERRFWGLTPACGFERAKQEAEDMAAALNAGTW